MGKIDLNETTATAPTIAFAPKIFERLPGPLKEMVYSLIDPTERGVFLMGALGTLSGLLPNIQGLYDGMTVYPNLYVFIIGPYGSGKSALGYARMLGQALHRQKLAETMTAKENRQENEPEPPQLLHFIPANNSKTGFFELLNGNQGAGTLFESEGDTLSDAIRQDFGNFSDGLRKGFHHEPISYYRRANREFVEIDNPRLSVVLSATFDQMLTLIPTSENGLFSRFCFYNLPGDPKFKDVFAPGKINYQERFRLLGLDIRTLYEYLSGFEQPFIFQYTDDQRAQFITKFQTLKDKIRNDITSDLDGLVNRLGLQHYRISMILSVFRHLDDKIPTNIDGLTTPFYCGKEDFELAGQIIDVLTAHAIDVFLQLPQPQEYSHKLIDRAEDVRKAIELRRAGHSYAAISEAIFGNANHKSTIYRWTNNKT